MARVKTGYEDINFTYNKGRQQDSDDFIAGSRFGMAHIVVEAPSVTTTSGTLYPHHAGLANMLARVEIYDNNKRTYIDADGATLFDKFGSVEGVYGDNASLPGGAATTAPMRVHLRVPFDLEDGLNPGDTLLQSLEKRLSIKITYRNPEDQGVLFGDTTGLVVADGIQVYIATEQFRLRGNSKLANTTPFARSYKASDVPITQNNDTFKLELETNQEYRGVFLVGESLQNGVWVPDANVINYDKLLSVKSTRNKNVYHALRARLWRSKTKQARRDANLRDGVFDIDFLYNGEATGTIESVETDKLFLEIPVKAQAGDTRIRYMVDTLTTQVAVR